MATALPGTGVPVSTDPITTLNGGAATASEVIQRAKISTGAPGTATDVSTANPFPVSGPVTGLAGAVLALDGADITAPTAMPAGGVGMRGWLSAIWTKLNGTLNDNIAQVGGAAIAAKTLPTGALGQTAIPVYTNTIQLLTYVFGVRALATAALTANTAKPILSLEVAATGAKTIKVRRIIVSGYQVTALAGTLDIQLTRGVLASTAGTAVTGGARSPADTAATVVVKSLPTIGVASVVDNMPFAVTPTAVANGAFATVLFDWQEAGETKPWMLLPGAIGSLVLNAISTAAQSWILTVQVIVTEE